MAKDIKAAVREICLSFPEVEERMGHGMPDYKVRGRSFATLAINHHGDGRIALWIHAPPGAQELHVDGEPEFYFVPPYVGPRGWLGVHLDQGNDWFSIAARVQEAYANVAPDHLATVLGDPPEIEPPAETVDPEDFDPLSAPHAQDRLARIRDFCISLPETSEGTQFGIPAFKAGKKTFLTVHRHRKRMRLEFRVGPELQSTLCDDPRFSIPAYIGHRGWIDLDVEDRFNWEEVQQLALGSYRHFALKRMLKALPPALAASSHQLLLG
ncbi:MAG: MmcQ/YjbR family DNA-binding protein [Gammaproteobacteria bacterium]|nr:MmcQ/YjbR family DNA-binding protein [Gammaproteobacteria bacterium]